MSFHHWIATITKPFRHGLVKRISPKLYQSWLVSRSLTTGVPRPMTLFLKDYMGDNELTGCEIGVATGRNAESMLETLNIKHLYLVDPYTQYLEKDLVDRHTGDYAKAELRLADFRGQVIWILALASEALKWLPKKLDFVYIDGCHSYQSAKHDLRQYYEIVKHGGVIGGHDFFGDYHGVVKAVVEFADEKELDLHGKIHDFWFIKN